MSINKLKTNWDLQILGKFNFKKERKETLKKLEKFYRKWITFDLKSPENLINFIKDYEKLISTPPGIFDREYAYYFLKSLLNTRDKKSKTKLEKIKNLRQNYFDKIFSLLEPLKTINKKEINKILNSSSLKNYRCFIERTIHPADEIFKILESPKLSLLREKISDEIKKYKESLFNDRNLQEKVLKKYTKLGEIALNESLEKFLQLEKKFNLKFSYYDNFFTKGFDRKLIKIIKKIVIKNAKKINDLTKTESKKELNSYLQSRISFKEAMSFIIESFKKIDKTFSKLILKFFQKGLVDVYPRKNKYLTPRNVTPSIFLPTFILLNFERDFKSLPHVIHEFAHAIHTEFLKQNNSPLNANQSSIIRETIALFFEFQVLKNLKEKYSIKWIDLYLNKVKINSIYFNAVLFLTAEDSYEYYKKTKHLSFNKLAKIFKKNLNLILGKNKVSQRSNYEILLYFSRGILWHFPYLVGAILSNILQDLSKDNLLKLLKIGSDKPLEEIFKEIGVNIYKESFWKNLLK